MKPDHRWVQRIERLLDRADNSWQAGPCGTEATRRGAARALRKAQEDEEGAPVARSGAWRRVLLSRIQLCAKHFGLADEVQAFVHVVGRGKLDELADGELKALYGWLEQWTETDCDVIGLLGALE